MGKVTRGTLEEDGASLSVWCDGATTVKVHLAGRWAGTVKFSASKNGHGKFVPALARPAGKGAPPVTLAASQVSGATENGIWEADVAGYKAFEVTFARGEEPEGPEESRGEGRGEGKGEAPAGNKVQVTLRPDTELADAAAATAAVARGGVQYHTQTSEEGKENVLTLDGRKNAAWCVRTLVVSFSQDPGAPVLVTVGDGEDPEEEEEVEVEPHVAGEGGEGERPLGPEPTQLPAPKPKKKKGKKGAKKPKPEPEPAEHEERAGEPREGEEEDEGPVETVLWEVFVPPAGGSVPLPSPGPGRREDGGVVGSRGKPLVIQVAAAGGLSTISAEVL